MIKLQDVKTIFHKDQYLPIQDKVAKLERPRKRLIELLVNSALKPDEKTVERWATASKAWELQLLR